MSILPHEETIIQGHHSFGIHRRTLITDFWGEEQFQDIHNNPTVDAWTPATHVLGSLWRKLPFGRTLSPERYNNVIDSFTTLVEDAREQLLYWHTAGPLATREGVPLVDGLVLFANVDYLWFYHIAPIQQHIKNSILAGERIRYLEQFRLTYDLIEITFGEIRLSPIQSEGDPLSVQTPYRLVITDGRTHTFRFNTTFWETDLDNPDPSLTNPEEFRLPPSAPSNPRYHPANFPDEYQAARDLDNERSRRIHFVTPRRVSPSPPVIPLINRISDQFGQSETRWESPPTTPDQPFRACFCGIDVCTCQYRPDTPPTPTEIRLWRPGVNYLPSNHRAAEQ